jgi:energy-coupling factor transporter ATP-binding protein EcfA2
MHARPDRDRKVVTCDRCAAETGFEPLPPLLWLTGASGSGKTTIYQILLGRVPEAILIDADLLWGVNPAHDDPASNYRRFYQLLFQLAIRLARNGRPVVVEGTAVPESHDSLGERHLFSHVAYLALVCDDHELETRLLDRPAWRKSREMVPAMLALNQYYKTSPPAPGVLYEVLDTTDDDPHTSADAVHGWIRRLGLPEA